MNKFSGIVVGNINQLTAKPPVLPLRPGTWTLQIHSIFIDNIKPEQNPERHIYSRACQFCLSSNFVTQFDSHVNSVATDIVETPLHILGSADQRPPHTAFYFTVPHPTPHIINTSSNQLRFTIEYFQTANENSNIEIYDTALYCIHYSLQRVCNEV